MSWGNFQAIKGNYQCARSFLVHFSSVSHVTFLWVALQRESRYIFEQWSPVNIEEAFPKKLLSKYQIWPKPGEKWRTTLKRLYICWSSKKMFFAWVALHGETQHVLEVPHCPWETSHLLFFFIDIKYLT